MKNIGFISIGKSEEQIVNQLFDNDHYIVVPVSEKKQLEKLNGLVLDVEGDDDFHQVCEWLINCQSVPNMFVWIVLPEVNLREINIYLHLGVNGCLLQENKVIALPLIIQNSFKRTVNDVQVPKEINKDIYLNDTNMSVIINGEEEILLTRSEYLILQILYRKKGTTVSYQSIYETLWNKQPKNDIHRIVNLVFHLRRKIEAQGKRYIHTVRSKGYRFVV